MNNGMYLSTSKLLKSPMIPPINANTKATITLSDKAIVIKFLSVAPRAFLIPISRLLSRREMDVILDKPTHALTKERSISTVRTSVIVPPTCLTCIMSEY